VRRRFPRGVDAVLDILGMSAVLESLKMVRYGGRVAVAGFLGGQDAVPFDVLRDLPSGVQLSFFASAFVLGGPDLPLAAVPFQSFVGQAERGVYSAAPAHVFAFEEIVAAHRLMDAGTARGKIVVRAPS
jgi:NADPH:quinone reductase-like Zn-dependent oxidoreductase